MSGIIRKRGAQSAFVKAGKLVYLPFTQEERGMTTVYCGKCGTLLDVSKKGFKKQECPVCHATNDKAN